MAVTAPLVSRTGVGVCAALGFRAGAAAAGIREDGDDERLDVAIVHSTLPCNAAGVFTRNTVKAAPVVISQLTLKRNKPVHAVLLNAGNANCCTGPQGFRDALLMCNTAAEALELDPAEVLVCSTGVIGRPLPMQRMVRGIKTASMSLSRDASDQAARAIMTTDRRPKSAASSFALGRHSYIVGGIAKGAGMIHPDMATMLCVLTTDAPVQRDVLQATLRAAVDDTFNVVTIDGDSSTNDTVLLLANASAGGDEIGTASPLLASFENCVREVCDSLAQQIAADGEGATKHFKVAISGAVDSSEGRLAARAVAGSTLVKTAFHGCDPNWGRIVAALGRSGASFTLDRCRVAIGGITVFANGAPAEADLNALRSLLSKASVVVDIDLGAGEAAGQAWGCDLSPEYVRINAEYTT
jgi:glutamate N-acetyltransferase/amino-acid N-acetyltransferase